MNLLDTPYAPFVKELLKVLEKKDLFGLASTASNQRLVPETSREAVEIILRYTNDLGRFFSYRRINSQLLFDYLHEKRVKVTPSSSKNQLIDTVKQLWDKSIQEKQPKSSPKVKPRSPDRNQRTQLQTLHRLQKVTTYQPRPTGSYAQPSPSPSSTSISVNLVSGSASTLNISLNPTGGGMNMKLEVGQGHGVGGMGQGMRSDVFSKAFCKWWYTMINRLQAQCSHLPGDTFGPNAFVSNCSAHVYLIGLLSVERHASGPEDTCKLLQETFNEFQICFSANFEDGTQAHKSTHGLVRILSCGTLHQLGSIVGIFEQEFNVVRCPINHQWKIVNTKLNLKQTHAVTALPALPKCEIFEIP